MLKSTAEEEEANELATTKTAGGGARWINRVMTEVERLSGVPLAELETALSISTSPSQVFDFAFAPVLGAKNITSRAFFLLRLATLPIGSAFIHEPSTLGKTWLRDWLYHSGLFDPAVGVAPADVWADFEHLSALQSPPAPLPRNLLQDAPLALDILKLGRPDAMMAWSVPL